MRHTTTIALTFLLLVASANAVRQVVQLEKPQPARRVEGFVLDPSGAPIPGMTVTDRTKGWGTVLRSTTTDDKGHFHFSQIPGKVIYYLQFDDLLFNPLELKLKLDKKSRRRAITARPQIGG